MDIGFTGTQQGMTDYQKVAVGSLLDVLKKTMTTVHHGDCIGADAEFHDMAVSRDLHIEIHPPVNPAKRAFCQLVGEGHVMWPKYDYLTRNQHIVDSADVLIATTAEFNEVTRSGTWSTIRRALRKGIPTYIVYPDGVINEHNPANLIGRV